MKDSDYYTVVLNDGTVDIIRASRLGGGQFPQDEQNADYRVYLEWVAEGNTPEPWQLEGGE